MKHYCRVCFTKSDYLTPIFNTVFKSNIDYMLGYCTGLQIKIDDGKPNQICQCCIDNLHIAYNFKRITRKNDKLFLKVVYGIKDVKIKLERIDTNIKVKTEKDAKVEIDIPPIKTECDVPVIKIDDSDDNASIHNDNFDDNLENDIKTHQNEEDNMFINDRVLLNDNDGVIALAKDDDNDDDDFFWRDDEDLMNVLESNAVETNNIEYKSNQLTKKPRKKYKTRKDKGGTHKKKNENKKAIMKDSKKRKRRKVPLNRYCYCCDKNFETIEACNQHKLELHGGVCSIGICEVCGKTFDRYNLRSHTVSHYPPQFVCTRPGCKYTTHYKAYMVKHTLQHKDKTFGLKICASCPRTYNTTSALTEHVRRAHDVRRRSFQCSFCPKAFYQNQKRKLHERTHTDDRQYKCEFCESAFVRRDAWRGHLLKQHNHVVPQARPGCKRNRIVEIHTLKDAGATILQTSESLELKDAVQSIVCDSVISVGGMSQNSETLQLHSVDSTDYASEVVVEVDNVANKVVIEYLEE